jgi:hypothetical protein
MEQMEAIRDQQESLAKLHFDLAGKLDPFAPLSEDGKCWEGSVQMTVLAKLLSSTVSMQLFGH